MKYFLAILVFLMSATLTPAPAFSEIEPNLPIEHFSTQGVVTHLDPARKVVYLKTERGLELTFHISETTVITQGQETKSLADLAPEDEIEIEYDYNQDYEKVARSVKKKSKPSAS